MEEKDDGPAVTLSVVSPKDHTYVQFGEWLFGITTNDIYCKIEKFRVYIFEKEQIVSNGNSKWKYDKCFFKIEDALEAIRKYMVDDNMPF